MFDSTIVPILTYGCDFFLFLWWLSYCWFFFIPIVLRIY